MYDQICACWSPRDETVLPSSWSGLRASSRCRTLVAVIGTDRAFLGTIQPGFWTGPNKHPRRHLRLKKQSEIERYHRFCRCLCTMRARGRLCDCSDPTPDSGTVRDIAESKEQCGRGWPMGGLEAMLPPAYELGNLINRLNLSLEAKWKATDGHAI